jgi:hypothetical protein
MLLVAVPGTWSAHEARSGVDEGLFEDPDPGQSAELPVPDMVMGYLDAAVPGGLPDLGMSQDGFAHLSRADVQALRAAVDTVPGVPQVDDTLFDRAFGAPPADHEREALTAQLTDLHRLLTHAAATGQGLLVALE